MSSWGNDMSKDMGDHGSCFLRYASKSYVQLFGFICLCYVYIYRERYVNMTINVKDSRPIFTMDCTGHCTL